jgi:FMN phosphatase YigB (HAD superfamily)
MINYNEIDPSKKAYIFELDDVLFPAKDYLLQVYYLFANFIEYTETFPLSIDLTAFMKLSYESMGADGIFERAQEAFAFDAKYKEEFERLHYTARLPLKLLLYKEALTLLQEIVMNRKNIFLVTNGKPEQQLNKIQQIEWNGLEEYLIVYFAEELKPKPDTEVLDYMLDKYDLTRKELLIIGGTERDQEFASATGIDYLAINEG